MQFGALAAALTLATAAALVPQLTVSPVATPPSVPRASPFDANLNAVQTQLLALGGGEIVGGPLHVTATADATGVLIENATGHMKEYSLTILNRGDTTIRIAATKDNAIRFVGPGQSENFFFGLVGNNTELQWRGEGDGSGVDFIYAIRRVALN